MTLPQIPVINIAALFTGPSAARDEIDTAIMAAATHFGFFAAAGTAPLDPVEVPSRSDRNEACAGCDTAKPRKAAESASAVDRLDLDI